MAYEIADFLAGLFGIAAPAAPCSGWPPSTLPGATGGDTVPLGSGRHFMPDIPTAADAPSEEHSTLPPWPGALADWALLIAPDDLPGEFVLRQGETVVCPERFLESLRRDIKAGPGGPRARYGAIQSDLRYLRDAILAARLPSSPSEATEPHVLTPNTSESSGCPGPS